MYIYIASIHTWYTVMMVSKLLYCLYCRGSMYDDALQSVPHPDSRYKSMMHPHQDYTPKHIDLEDTPKGPIHLYTIPLEPPILPYLCLIRTPAPPRSSSKICRSTIGNSCLDTVISWASLWPPYAPGVPKDGPMHLYCVLDDHQYDVVP